MKKSMFSGLKVMFLISFLFILVFSCEKEDTVNVPKGLSASDGTYIGTIFINWDPVPDAEAYEIWRKDPFTGEWEELGWLEDPLWWDIGWLLPGEEIIPGQVYQYKCRAHRNEGGFSDFTDVEEGFAFNPEKVTVTEITRVDENHMLLVWTDPNNESTLVNRTMTNYNIYFAIQTNLNNINLTGTTSDKNFTDYLFAPDETYYYKVAIAYDFMIDGTPVTKEFDADMIKEGNGGDELETINYSRTGLITINSVSDGISFVEMKIENGIPYLGVLKDYTISGNPGIYKLNGTTWEELGGTLPSDITTGSITDMGIAAGSSNQYLAGLDGDSIYIYGFNGSSWSENLAAGNMGMAQAPAAMDLEVLSNEVFVAMKAYPDWDLTVVKWTGSSWNSVGGDVNGWIESDNDVFNVALENFDGTLYLYYTVQNSDYNHTLHIKHLNGTTWETDLAWTADYIMNIQVAQGSGILYFTSSTQWLAQYRGGVYKVTSTSTVETLADGNDDWFYTPYAIAVDSDGNVIICSEKIESQSAIYPALFLYDGNNWKSVSGDFSDGDSPVAVRTIGTDIYYAYGDASNQTALNDPKALKSARFTK